MHSGAFKTLISTCNKCSGALSRKIMKIAGQCGVFVDRAKVENYWDQQRHRQNHKFNYCASLILLEVIFWLNPQPHNPWAPSGLRPPPKAAKHHSCTAIPAEVKLSPPGRSGVTPGVRLSLSPTRTEPPPGSGRAIRGELHVARPPGFTPEAEPIAA